MGDWADMEIALGWDAGDFPCDDDDKTKNYYDDMEMKSIEINLTPSKYLQSEEAKYLRAKLINNELKNSEIRLEVMHDRYNNADRLALEVYCNKIMIGHIQKFNSLEDINNFCFTNNKKVDTLKLKWGNNKFELSKYISIQEQKQLEEEAVKSRVKKKKEEEKKYNNRLFEIEKEKQEQIKGHKVILKRAYSELYDDGFFGWITRSAAKTRIEIYSKNLEILESQTFGVHDTSKLKYY